jgi:hypothetical protein
MEAVNLGRRTYIRDGAAFPITDLFDAAGDKTDDPAEAVFAVAGREGEWYALNLSEFQGGTATQ